LFLEYKLIINQTASGIVFITGYSPVEFESIININSRRLFVTDGVFINLRFNVFFYILGKILLACKIVIYGNFYKQVLFDLVVKEDGEEKI